MWKPGWRHSRRRKCQNSRLRHQREQVRAQHQHYHWDVRSTPESAKDSSMQRMNNHVEGKRRKDMALKNSDYKTKRRRRAATGISESETNQWCNETWNLKKTRPEALKTQRDNEHNLDAESRTAAEHDEENTPENKHKHDNSTDISRDKNHTPQGTIQRNAEP